MAVTYIPPPKSLMMRDDRRKLALQGGKRLSIFPFWEERTVRYRTDSSVVFGGYSKHASGIWFDTYIYPWQTAYRPEDFIAGLEGFYPDIYRLEKEDEESDSDFRARVAAVEAEFKRQGILPEDKSFLIGKSTAALTVYNGSDEVIPGSFVTSCSQRGFPGRRIYLESEPDFPPGTTTGASLGCPDLYIDDSENELTNGEVFSCFYKKHLKAKGVCVWALAGDSVANITPVRKQEFEREIQVAVQILDIDYAPPYQIHASSMQVAVLVIPMADNESYQTGGFSNVAGDPADRVAYSFIEEV